VRPLKSFILPALTSLALLSLAPAAGAADEVGDAGDLPATAQDLTGAAVERIDGTLAPEDVDMYRLCLDGGGSFSASAVGGTQVDTQLFLFDSSGRGVYSNDDLLENVVSQSLLPAGHPLTPSAQGEYLLAVGIYNIDPQSAGGPIFPSETIVVGPTGPGGGEPVVAWGGRPLVGGAYSLTITGAECAPGDDTTPPVIDLRSPVNGAVVRPGDPVEVDFSCSDEGGSELASCDGTVPDGGLLDTSSPGPASVTVTATDNAGNVASVTHTVQVVPLDLTPPAIQLLSPLDGAVYLLDDEVWADYSCSDGDGTGVASCAGPVPAGGRVDTSTVGAHDFTVTAADNAGNAASATARFRVVYDFEAFLWPVKNRPRSNTWKAGVPVPIRFELGGNQGLGVIEDGWPQVAVVGCDFTEEPEAGEPTRHPRWFRELVYRRRKQRYVYLWRTERRWAGTCRQFMLKLKDGTVRRADFKFVRGWSHGRDDDDDSDRGSDSDSDSDD
jgi:hypothetical protein